MTCCEALKALTAAPDYSLLARPLSERGGLRGYRYSKTTFERSGFFFVPSSSNSFDSCRIPIEWILEEWEVVNKI